MPSSGHSSVELHCGASEPWARAGRSENIPDERTHSSRSTLGGEEHPRREYSSELIEVSPAGLHRAQSVSPPAYIQGPGGLGQVFQGLSKTPEATL